MFAYYSSIAQTTNTQLPSAIHMHGIVNQIGQDILYICTSEVITCTAHFCPGSDSASGAQFCGESFAWYGTICGSVQCGVIITHVIIELWYSL